MDSIPEFTAYFTATPLEADEFIWLTRDQDRADAVLMPRPSPFKADKLVYLIDATEELNTLFDTLSKEDFKALNFRVLKEFSHRNCGVPGVSMIAFLKAARPAE